MNLQHVSPIAFLLFVCTVAACGSEPQRETATDTASPAPATSSQPPAQQTAAPAGPHHVSGFVFEDKNRNGTYDASDVRLGQQTVVLTDPSNVKEIQSVTTGPDGSFRVEQLVAGEYRLTLRIPEGFERTVDDSFVITVGPEAAIPEVQFGMASR